MQQVDTFISTSDIRSGDRWLNSINDALKGNEFGIIFLTSENLKSPWLNFESGALSVALNTRVIPIDFSHNDELSKLLSDSPLQQFNRVVNIDKNYFYTMIKTLNESTENPMENGVLEKTFEMWWPDLNKNIESIQERFKNVDSHSSESLSNTDKLLIQMNEKISGLANQNQRIARNRLNHIPTGLIRDLEISDNSIEQVMGSIEDSFPQETIQLERTINRIEKVIRYLQLNSYQRPQSVRPSISTNDSDDSE